MVLAPEFTKIEVGAVSMPPTIQSPEVPWLIAKSPAAIFPLVNTVPCGNVTVTVSPPVRPVAGVKIIKSEDEA